MYHISRPVPTRICSIALNGTGRAQALAMASTRRTMRGYVEPPPALETNDPRHPRFDPLYASLDPQDLPASESLRDCQRRMLPYWNEVLVPRLRAGRHLLVVSHGDTLRGLVMHLDGLSAEAMERGEIPSGVPLVVRFAADLSVAGREWLGSAA